MLKMQEKIIKKTQKIKHLTDRNSEDGDFTMSV